MSLLVRPRAKLCTIYLPTLKQIELFTWNLYKTLPLGKLILGNRAQGTSAGRASRGVIFTSKEPVSG